ncbi:tetratricopeptide repeat protein [Amycolatopsis cynarae]|uniref:Tetratricopeptide repeat protein n=1 Tax=Amycolatopsis cynarae TaxID=2995223 RepID=A0ABY7BAH4_9PSEU|nr:tetratricopeptide repeat protein [Amycolatopsis sp. HUAS 11-8]WAL68227.1 tetratricopeptide repeat protein [Amycolatopsis sp. HUAS 11-8]
MTNTLSGAVAGPVIQAGSIHQVHFHPGRPRVTPAQLPAPPPVSGRDRELEELDAFLKAQKGSPLPLVLITGPGGVGKTSLALSWLHRHRDEYRDGQLYVDLHAFGPGGPLSPDTALAWFLVALGVPPAEIPAELPERSALFRSVTAGLGLVILLDNAFSAAQVHPLLPASESALCVVTSRWRLAGLALSGRSVELEPFSIEESAGLLKNLVGEERTTAEPAAVRRVASACGGLPLALSTVAARLRTRGGRTFEQELRTLTDGTRLLRLDTADGRSLQAVFDASYAALTTVAADIYLVCGLHPGPDFRIEAVTAASSHSRDAVLDGLDQLVEANLLIEDATGRFHFHDLLREHARTRAERQLRPAARNDVLRAYVRWYLAATVEATGLVHPHRPGLLCVEPADSSGLRFDRPETAMAWLVAEQRSIRAVLLAADRHGWPSPVWRFCEALWGFFLHHRHYQEWIEIQRLGISAARRAGQPLAEARLHSQLGFAYAKLGRFDEAAAENEIALRLGEAHSDGPTVATALSQLGRAARGRKDLPAALRYFRQAAEIQETLGILRGVALCRRRAGDVLAELGRTDEAVIELTAAAHLMAELGDPIQHARTLMVLGSLRCDQGRHDQGIPLLHETLSSVRASGSPYYTAEILLALGKAEAGSGLPAAADHLAEARDLYQAAGDPRAAQASSLLAAVQDGGSADR